MSSSSPLRALIASQLCRSTAWRSIEPKTSQMSRGTAAAGVCGKQRDEAFVQRQHGHAMAGRDLAQCDVVLVDQLVHAAAEILAERR